MKGIVELRYDIFFDKLEIMRSVAVTDKNDYYEVKFQYQNGYIKTESFIKKKEIGIPKDYYHSRNIVVMYVNKINYENNPEEFHQRIKNFQTN
jgi:hypothetical protein